MHVCRTNTHKMFIVVCHPKGKVRFMGKIRDSCVQTRRADFSSHHHRIASMKAHSYLFAPDRRCVTHFRTQLSSSVVRLVGGDAHVCCVYTLKVCVEVYGFVQTLCCKLF